MSDTNLQSEARTCRLLYAAALFCRYHDFDSTSDMIENITNQNLKPGKIVQTIYSITIGWISKSSELIKQKAARSLGFLLIRQPKLFLVKQTQTAISQSLSSENKDFVYEVVLMFKDFLLAEESKLSSATHQENMDAGVTSTLMLSYIDALIALLDDTTDYIRHATLEVLELTVQQGLTIPSKIMKYTLAMESDPNSDVREKAHTINLYLKDRFLKMFTSEARHSFSKAFMHLNNINEKSVIVKGIIDGKSAFHGIYSFVADFGPETKKGILCDVIRSVFNSMESNNIENVMLLKEVTFMIEALIHLPYKSLYEVAEIVTTLGEKLDMLGDSVKEELKNQIKNEEKELKYVRKYITLSCCLCFLIQFKNTLQVRYNLTNSKMEEYSADSKSFIKKIITSSSIRDVSLVEFNLIIPKLVKTISSQDYEDETIAELYQWSKKIIKSHMHDGFNVTVGKAKRGKRKTSTTKKTTKKKPAPKKRKKAEEEEEYSGEDTEEDNPPNEEEEETPHESASEEEEVEPIQTRKRTKRK